MRASGADDPAGLVLIVAEDPSSGFYGPGLADAVAEAALSLGLRPVQRQVPFVAELDATPPDLADEMRAADATVFLARMGDQLRFSASMAAARPVVSYALDALMLDSAFGRADQRAMVALKDCIDAAFAGARHVRVTCPLGTDFEGRAAAFPGNDCEVTVRRFSLSVFTPVPAGPSPAAWRRPVP